MKDLSVVELDKLMSEGKSLFILDVREAEELAISKLANSFHVPLMELEDRVLDITSEIQKLNPDYIIALCRGGSRSEMAAHFLESRGIKNIHNLVGGINEYAKRIDNTLKVY